ncbi:extracellular solute-binding protein [Amylibacter sp.]|jgi:multiple sugar transport system substrate-binding protein|nr:extracellular solute-binding protein [Amylibacter sp.]
MSRFLDFIEQQDDEVRRALSIKTGYDETKLFVALLRNHLNGKLTTSSSLAQSSGLSYGTSIRAISSIEDRGLLVRRSRTDTGKSFSLHPSEKLILEWQEYARRVHSLLDSTIGLSSKLGQKSSDYFYGSSYNSGSILSPPSVLSSKLSLNKQLRILVHADPTFMAMHVLKKQFESILGVPIQSRALSIDRLREEIIKNSTAKHSNYDIIACDLPWFGEMAEKGRFLPLDNLISNTGFDTSDFHSEALASARYKGNQYGVPVQTTPDLLVYRRDLFESKGLKAPHTIDDTLIAAQTLHSRSRNVSGIAWNAARGTPLGHTFLFTMGAFGQPAINLRAIENGFDGENVIGENFRPMFNTNAARQSAEYLLELLNYSPSSILSMSWYERARAYADGEVGMAYCATLLAPLFELNAKSPAYGVSEFLPHPCGKGSKQIAPVGGYALAIPSNVSEERISPIWTALMSLTSPQTIKLYIENGSLVSPRFSVSMDPKVRQISPLISKVDEMARFGVLQMWPRPPVPEISNIIAIAGEEMHDMLIGVKSIDEALNNSQNRADAIMRMNGHY